MGGVALNCVANSIIARDYYPKLWILPNPGDAGSSLGSAAYFYGKHINWTSPFTGYDIEGKYPVKKLVNLLVKGNIVGVANGRAEFGPRALGSRSFLADPRNDSIRDQINQKIKKRELFRPFAPSTIAETIGNFFEMNH